jgi:large subunit ribosomal protein L4
MPAKKPVKTIKKTPVKKAVKTAVKPATVKPEVKKISGLTAEVYDLHGKVVEKMQLPKEIFAAKENAKLIAQAVRVYLNNQRRGTSSTKSRGEVKATTKKIWRQKGTGRARHGAKSAPIFVGGGVAFGPKPRDFSLNLSKKMKKAALFAALSAKQKDGEIKILKGLDKIEPKTKNVQAFLAKMDYGSKKRNILIVVAKESMENAQKAAGNLQGVRTLRANLLNTYDVLNNKCIIFAKESIEDLKSNFLKEETK